LDPQRKPRISSNLLIGIVVGVFVGVVVLGLIFANLGYLIFPNTTNGGPAITFSGYELFSGSNSSISYTSSCRGDAYLIVDISNNSPNSIQITNVTIYGSSLKQNASTLVSVSNNSCLPLSQANPSVPGNSSYEFVGYLNIGLAPLTNCYFLMQFGDGQELSHLMVAQV
jgi:hypothetical protein